MGRSIACWPLALRYTGRSSNRWICLFILIGSGNLYPLLYDTIMVSGRLPNTFPEMISKDNLETSIIQSAAFAAGFLEVILIFKTCQNAPFRARFLDMIKLELHRKHLSSEYNATLISFVMAM